MDEPEKKNIDEDYKAQVEKEKQAAASQEEFMPPEPTFPFFITTLAMQVTVNLGDMPNPQNNKSEENLTQAKFLIDTLSMLQEKTKNNLTKEEGSLLENILFELRMRYVQKGANPNGGEGK